MKEFRVYVAVFNCDEFVNRYRKYIHGREDSWYGDYVYTLIAPQEIYDEIADLKEESIEII